MFAGRGRDNLDLSKAAAIWYASLLLKEGTLQPKTNVLLWFDHYIYAHHEFDERMLSFIHGHDIAYIHRDILPKYLKSYG